MAYKKKLIEVALPLEVINDASAREKSIRQGHPSTLHLWWSRKPLAVCRAVLFASLVDDPSSHPEQFPDEKAQAQERQRLFAILGDLVKWENSGNEQVLEMARAEILKSTGGEPPPVYDPFCGGGSIPLEAQRLGLCARGSDLNPVAVLITKALIELPAKFAGRPPVNSAARGEIGQNNGWQGAAGLAADVRYYGRWLRDEAEKRLGRLYPKVTLPAAGGEGTVIAWLWVRTVKCPNPACGCDMPLASKFTLSAKKGREVWVEPQVDRAKGQVSFVVRTGPGQPPAGTVDRRGAKCICCGTPVPLDYIRELGRQGRIGGAVIAQVVAGKEGKMYVSPGENNEPMPTSDFLTDLAAARISGYFNPPNYGYASIGALYNPRQRYALATFAGLVKEAKAQCLQDGGDEEYAAAVATYLALAVGRLANRLSSFAIWNIHRETIEQTFSEQGVAMAWDYAEANPFSGSTGSWEGSLEWIPKCLELLPGEGYGTAEQKDAAAAWGDTGKWLISTDPPYYSSITYADFADFFYGVLRQALKEDYPELFATVATPKAAEIVAARHRFDGDRVRASEHFRGQLERAVKNIYAAMNDDYPATIYYAFKEQEVAEKDEGYYTAWESILGVLIGAGLQIVCTWPLRTERVSGRKTTKNALASSIVLVCRKRAPDAPVATRREFVAAVKRGLPAALKGLAQSNIPPVDLAQAAIGPGMAIFSQYRQVYEADGEPMSVRTALQIVNQELDAYLAAQEGMLDEDTRFCLAWFEQFGLSEAPFGVADVLARAKNTSVERLVSDGVLAAAKGKVRLLKWEELAGGWQPGYEGRITVWRFTQQITNALLGAGGEDAAARLVYFLGGARAEQAKALAYRLYAICERKGWSEAGLAYNSLVVSWPAIQQKVGKLAAKLSVQGELAF